MAKQLIYHIRGENHFLVKYTFFTKEGADLFKELCLKYDCILHSMKKKGFFNKYVISHILVPEKNLKRFNLEMFTR